MKRFFVAGVLALCLMTSQIARAEEKRDAKIKAEMVQNYLLWQEAYKNKDAERIISFESPDYTRIWADTGQLFTKSEADTTLRKAMESTVKVYEARVEIKKILIESSRVLVLSNHYRDMDIQSDGKQTQRYSGTLYLRDIWVRYDKVWMLKRVECLSSKWILDGKTGNS